jgi:hypothetical protein
MGGTESTQTDNPNGSIIAAVPTNSDIPPEFFGVRFVFSLPPLTPFNFAI